MLLVKILIAYFRPGCSHVLKNFFFVQQILFSIDSLPLFPVSFVYLLFSCLWVNDWNACALSIQYIFHFPLCCPFPCFPVKLSICYQNVRMWILILFVVMNSIAARITSWRDLLFNKFIDCFFLHCKIKFFWQCHHNLFCSPCIFSNFVLFNSIK